MPTVRQPVQVFRGQLGGDLHPCTLLVEGSSKKDPPILDLEKALSGHAKTWENFNMDEKKAVQEIRDDLNGLQKRVTLIEYQAP